MTEKGEKVKKLKQIITAISIIVLVLSMATVGVSAEETEESLSEIREKIEENEAELDEKEAELKAGKKEEKSLASQVVELEKEINQLDVAITEGEAKLVVLEKELKEAQERVTTQTENLNSRLRNMYKNGNIGFLDVLLDSGSFSEFLTNFDLVKIIHQSDQEVLTELEEAHAVVEAKKEEVEALQAELETSRAVTAEQKQTVETKKKEIAASNEETEKMIEELQADADALTAKLQSMQSSGEVSSSSSSKYLGGEMAWPVPNATIVTSPFGYRTHPISGTRRFHTGIDLAGSGCYGTPIVAANDGTVISAGWNGGYGNCVIVDHGGGVTTLYAHASSIAVGYGQSVSRGETVAYIGSTGNSTGPHLHFEVRIDGAYQNPYPYIT